MKREIKTFHEIFKNASNQEYLVNIYDIFRMKEHFYIICEYCKQGSLLDYIKKYKNLDNRTMI